MHMQKWCAMDFFGVNCVLTLKSIPTVDIKLPDKKVPSRNRTSRHVLPTPESPSNMTCWIWTPVYSSLKHTCTHKHKHTSLNFIITMWYCVRCAVLCFSVRRAMSQRHCALACSVPILFFHLLDFVVFSSFFFVFYTHNTFSFFIIVFDLSDSQYYIFSDTIYWFSFLLICLNAPKCIALST